MKLLFLFFSMILFLTSCSNSKNETQKELKIATNEWIGYTPLFLADATGNLRKLHIKLIHNISLAEAANVFSVGKADMVTSTQHEYYAIKHSIKDIIPVILLDRSNGGDMILANKKIPELQKALKIKVYLEVDSINQELLKEFSHRYNIPLSRFTIINEDQQMIQSVQNTPTDTIMIVTYSPYDVTLKAKGFFEIASTRELDQLIVIDALCTREATRKAEFARLQQLKKVIDHAVDEIKTNPKESYELTKKYLGNISYSEFLDSLKLIEWINNPSPKLLDKIEKLGYKREYLIQ